MGALRHLFVAIGLTAIGCHEAHPLELPMPDGAQSVILLYESDVKNRADSAASDIIDGRAQLPPLTVDEESRLFLMFYPFDLEHYLIDSGHLEAPGPNDPIRALPTTQQRFYGQLLGGTLSWEKRDETREDIDDFKLKGFPRSECQNAGCFRTFFGDEVCDPVCNADAANPSEPSAPQDPNFLPCPNGWNAVTTQQIPVCDPPATVAQAAPCPPGDFADVEPPVLHVHTQGNNQGDGSVASPLATVGRALELATPGTTIALSKGTFSESFKVHTDEIAIVGACLGGTIVSSNASAVIELNAPKSSIQKLLIRSGNTGPAILTRADSTIISEVAIEGTGIIADGGESPSIHDVTVRDGGVGIRITSDTTEAMVQRVELTNNLGAGIELSGAATMIATDVIIRETSFSVDNRGFAIDLGSETSSEISRVLIENAVSGIRVAGTAQASLQDIVVRELRGAGPNTGYGFRALESAHATLSRVWIHRPYYHGFRVGHSNISATDLIVEQTQLQGDQAGDGIVLGRGANAELTRILVARNQAIGLAVHGNPNETAFADLTDIRVTETRLRSTDKGAFGVGLDVRTHATVNLIRASFENNDGPGIRLACREDNFPNGESCVDPQMTAVDVAISRSGSCGLEIINGVPRFTNLLLTHNKRFGGYIADSAIIENMIIRETLTSSITNPAQPVDSPYYLCRSENDERAGAGLYMAGDVGLKRTVIDGFEISDNDRGIDFEYIGTFSLSNGSFHDNDIGLDLERAPDDYRALEWDVAYYNNRANVRKPSE